MEFDWDDAKATANRRKHGVSFDEAVTVLFDPFVITSPDAMHSDADERERSVGVSSRLRVLLVVHTARDGDTIRLISARRASRQEAHDYEEEVERRLRCE